MNTLRNLSVDEAVDLVEQHVVDRRWVARIAGVPADQSMLADTTPPTHGHVDEQWVTLQAALANVMASTDRYWLPGGLAVHTDVCIAPGVSVDVAFLYLFPPPEGEFDLEDERP